MYTCLLVNMSQSYRLWTLALLLLIGSGSVAYSQTITGKVTEALNGNPVLSAAVTIQGTTIGTITDINGNYTLTGVQPDDNLRVMVSGFDVALVPVYGRTNVPIYLYPSGYGYSTYYSRQSGDFTDFNTWSYVGHTGVPAYEAPGSTGCTTIIGNGHVVTLPSNIDLSGCGLRVETGGTFDMAGFDIHLGGNFTIDGTILNPGALLSTFCGLTINSSSTAIPAFTDLIIDHVPGCPGTVTLNTDIILQNGPTIINGNFDPAGFTVYPCIPPTTSATNAIFSNKAGTSMTLGWTRGNGNGGVLVVARVSGTLQQKPQPGTPYNANAAFGSGDATGSNNFVVYKGTGTAVTITNLLPNTYYEFGIYEFNAPACYNVSNFLGATDNSGCVDPGSPLNPQGASYCAGNSPAEISVADPGAGRSINWYTAPTGGTFPGGATTSGTANEKLTPAGPGTYYAEIAEVTSGCVSLTRTAVTLVQNPLATAGPPSQTICSGAPAAISLSGAPSFSWTVSANPSITGAASGTSPGPAITQQLTNTSSSQQQITYTITPSTGCAATIPIVVNVTVEPAATLYTVSGGGTICAGDAGADITLNNDVNSITYELLLNGQPTSNTLSGAAGPVAFKAITVPGTYTIRTFIVAGGCSTTMNGSAQVSVETPPTGTGLIGGKVAICVGRDETYSVTGFSSNTAAYDWVLPSGMSILNQSGNNITVEVTGGTGGTISVSGRNMCGVGGSGSLSVSMLTPPDVSLTLPVEEPYAEEPVVFSYTSPATIAGQAWSFGDGSGSDLVTPEHIYAQGGTYTVSLQVTGNLGCKNSVSQSLVVRPAAALADGKIKNVVTANGDTKNAFLFIEDIHKFPRNEVVLLDRWGVEVFRKKGYNNDWDLSKDGEYLPAGNYVCILKLEETGQVYSRTITVIKRK